MAKVVPFRSVVGKVKVLRGQRVLLSEDLANLYGVPVKALNQAVKRNRGRFPSDFTFQLTPAEHERLRSQIVTSKIGRGGARVLPYAFTEQGVAMLSSVLKSKAAIDANVQIMRAFVALREMAISHRDFVLRLDALEKKYDGQFREVFGALRLLLTEKEKPRRAIGFRPGRV